MSDTSEVPQGMDMQIESEDGATGLKSVTITALSEQAEIDLESEYPRICKLLARDWLG